MRVAALSPGVPGVSQQRWPASQMRQFCATCFERAGVPSEGARLWSDTLVVSELRGVTSHGLLRLSTYVQRIQAGDIAPAAEPVVVQDQGVSAVMDGCNAPGQIVSSRAMALAIQKALSFGIGTVVTRNSNHFGAAAYFAAQALPHRCLGLVTSNTVPVMAPWGGLDVLVGNNPLAFAAPAGRYGAVLLDMAQSIVARGWLRLAMQEGESIPVGWALDAQGHPTTDPAAALEGQVLPIGTYKGYGLAVVMDILSGVLGGGAFGAEVPQWKVGAGPGQVSHFFLALNLERFLPYETFVARMETLIDGLKSSHRLPDTEAIYYPGEPELLCQQEQEREGLEVAPSTIAALRQLGRELGVEL